jgi:thiosulfate dehydrogenase
LLPVATEKEWQAPDEGLLSSEPNSQLIRYGKALVESTSHYLGPKGIVAPFLSNGMNCQNCHLKAGRQNFANPFSATASTYPKYRDRSGQVESILFRINDCMKRSLNGDTLDSASKEMQAMIAYIQWVGKNVPKGKTPKGAGTEKLSFLKRAADPQKGKRLFLMACSRCHGQNGEGTLLPDSSEYIYPPLWGEHSFNVSAGLYRLSSLAGFIKNNMPFGADWKQPQLSTEQAWDVAAYLVSQPRPVKFFSTDYRNLSKKPVDYPFGPYVDTFSEVQHKYGPFEMIKKK